MGAERSARLFCASLWLATCVTAGGAHASAAAPDPQVAEALVRDAATEIFDTVNANRALYESEPMRLVDMVDRLVLPHFDFDRMSQRVLGKHWRGASEEQRKLFADQFEALLVRTYVNAVREYSTERLEFLPRRVSEDGRLVTVRTQVATVSGLTVPISYEMYASDAGWKVYDVSVDGISLVINYRASFADEIRSRGIDGLIDRLSRHNSEASSG